MNKHEITKDELLKKVQAGIRATAIGDAMGVPFEFNRTTQIVNVFEVEPKKKWEWSDDTSMTLCLADAITLKNGEGLEPSKFRLDLKKFKENCVEWLYEGKFTQFGKTFGVGNSCMKGIAAYALNGKFDSSNSYGTGALMRCSPLVLFADSAEFYEALEQTNHFTHNNKLSDACCYIYIILYRYILDSYSLAEAIYLLNTLCSNTKDSYTKALAKNILKDNGLKPEDMNNRVDSILKQVVFCLRHSNGFKECLELAIGLGGDTDTRAAIVAPLALALFGEDKYFKSYYKKLYNTEVIESSIKFGGN